MSGSRARLVETVQQLSTDHLRWELESRGLPTGGSRHVLIEKVVYALRNPISHMDVNQTMFGMATSQSTSGVSLRGGDVTIGMPEASERPEASRNAVPLSLELGNYRRGFAANQTVPVEQGNYQPQVGRNQSRPVIHEGEALAGGAQANRSASASPGDSSTRPYDRQNQSAPANPAVRHAEGVSRANNSLPAYPMYRPPAGQPGLRPWFRPPVFDGVYRPELRSRAPDAYFSVRMPTPGATNRAENFAEPPNVPASSSPALPRFPAAGNYNYFPESVLRSPEHVGERGGRTEDAMSAYNIMRKWNLKFSGARGEDAEEFLSRIEEGRLLVPVTDTALLNCVPFFLSGIARTWFRSHRQQYQSWAEWEGAFRERFCDPRLQYSIRQEIFRRTQGSTEPVADYLTCIRSLFDRLVPPMAESEQLDIAHQNMQPRLQIAIMRPDVFSLESLERLAVMVEKSYCLGKSFQEPPAPESSLYPELAFHRFRAKPRAVTFNMLDPACSVPMMVFPQFDPSYPPPSVEHSQACGFPDGAPAYCYYMQASTSTRGPGNPSTPVRSALSNRPATPGRPATPNRAAQPAVINAAAPTTPVGARSAVNPFLTESTAVPKSPGELVRAQQVCHNCRQPGHFIANCPQPRVIRCYACGMEGQTKRTEHDCKGNDSRDRQ